MLLEELQLAWAEWPSSVVIEDIDHEVLREYGVLLECLAPTRTQPSFRWEPVDFSFPELEREARMFSLMTGEEERLYRESDLRLTANIVFEGDRAQGLERMIRDRRLAFMLGQGTYFLYSDEIVEGRLEGRRTPIPVGHEQSRMPSGSVVQSSREPSHDHTRRSFSQPLQHVAAYPQPSHPAPRASSLGSTLLRSRGAHMHGVLDLPRVEFECPARPLPLSSGILFGTQRHNSTTPVRRENRQVSNHRHPDRVGGVGNGEDINGVGMWTEAYST